MDQTEERIRCKDSQEAGATAVSVGGGAGWYGAKEATEEEDEDDDVIREDHGFGGVENQC